MSDMAAIFDKSADPVEQLAACEDLVRRAGWWGAIAAQEAWPVDTEQAADLLCRGGGYEATQGVLDDLIARNMLAPPAEDGWDGFDVLLAAQMLEDRRQWRAGWPTHRQKMHASWEQYQRLRQQGRLAELCRPEGEPACDARQLIFAMAACPNQELREKFASLLAAVLEYDHGVAI